MICIKAEIPEELSLIDDELKAIYHSTDTVCFFIFKTRQERNEFKERTQGMLGNNLLTKLNFAMNILVENLKFFLLCYYLIMFDGLRFLL